VRPPWEGLSGHFTKEFEAFALLLLRGMPVSRVASVVGETDTRLWRMLFRQVDAAYAQADFSQVCFVGVDELCVRKGREYLSERHLSGILAHWKWRLTNAFMEGFNNVFSATRRRARGYRSSVYLITILYLVAGDLRLPQF
jgi:hypothetical protein